MLNKLANDINQHACRKAYKWHNSMCDWFYPFAYFAYPQALNFPFLYIVIISFNLNFCVSTYISSLILVNLYSII